MKKLYSLSLVLATVFLLQACNESEVLIAPTPGDELSKASGNGPLNFTAHLTGDQEVPPATTNATGQVKFQVSKDRQSVSFKLIVANLEDVRMAHIHIAPAGVNGPVVVWLYPEAPPMLLIPGTTNGILAQRSFNNSNLTGPLVGMEISDLVAALKSGNAYVNVHTNAYPGGEIRGQIK
ncbi:MAG: CHRD domain-containing protein [Cyclobacteriaceae bacterium]|nr:CHRD domain-containing protein [Cyclobacteriaceae bacterium]